MATTAFVATDDLMLRSRSQVIEETEIRPLPLAQKVRVDGDDEREGWKKVTVGIDGQTLSGVVNGRFLRQEESPLKEALLKECSKHWYEFGRGFGREHWVRGREYCLINGEVPGADPNHPCGDIVTADKDYFKLVGAMWQSIGLNLTGKDRDQAWSAAFISLAVRKAGYTRFEFAQRHGIYVKQAIQAKLRGTQNADFWGFRINEHKPTLGDIVVQWRITRRDYDFAAENDAYKSHCDIVVEVRDGTVRTIGGNTRNTFGNKCDDTVGMKSFSLNDNGFLKPANNVFAVLRNNR